MAVERKKSCTPPKIAWKCRFPSDKNSIGIFDSGNGLIDPKSVSQDIKLILKVFEINTIWVKPFFFRPPSSSQPKNSFLARTHFFADFLKKGVKLLRKTYCFKQDMNLMFLKHEPCIMYSPPLLLCVFTYKKVQVSSKYQHFPTMSF